MRRAPALGVAALLLVVAGPVSAQQEGPQAELRRRGCCLDQVEDGAKIEEVEVDGNRALSEGTIENALATSESGFWPWSDDRYLSKSDFLDDLERLYILYQRHGYFDFELLSYDVRNGAGAHIRFEVSEGEPTLVDTLSLAGFDYSPEVEARIRDALPLKQGEIFNEADLVGSRTLLENGFQDRGYAFATVLLEYRIRKEAHTASVTYTVVPGEVYYYGEIDIEGEEDPGDVELVRGQLAFESGERYGRQEILDSQRRLYELGIYRRVEIEPRLGSVRGDTVDVVVAVVPSPTQIVRVGLGYGTEDLLRVSGSWLDRNFFGGSRQFELAGLYSGLERRAAASYRQPTFLVPDLDSSLTGFLRFDTEDNYTVERIGASGRLGYRVSRRIQASASLTVERANFSNFDEGVLIPELGRDFINPSRLMNADLRTTYDGTDSLFMPSRGFRADLAYQVGLPVASFDYGYHKVTILFAAYREVREGWVVAAKVLPGAISTFGGEQARVPLFQRLFAGGSTSVRGYERRQLGPKDDPAARGQTRDPEPIGGNALFETSLELRFPIRGNIRGTAFVDAGNVWSEPGDLALGDLEYTPGMGLQYVTPIGPIRLDAARRTSGEEEEFLPRWVFHISIGNAF
ncbi:MAG TPA: outer membrane protein assembly factor BamA [Gemmatimonadota bacterium]|nr:outer membrane protein assembly factor BamA [Gemmatimonadota bacterium]